MIEAASPTSEVSAWPRPPSWGALRGGEVHVWLTWLDGPHVCHDRLELTLSGEERRRARRLAPLTDRPRFVARRGLLRTILAGYTGRRAEDLELRTAAAGKPELVPTADAAHIQFNCSSSGDLAVYAVARDLHVGVDVERVRAVLEPIELARSVMSDVECARLAALPERRRHEAFLERWTRTEAHLKARGDGLAGLGEPGETDRLWSTRALALAGGYVGAVAADGIGWRLRCLRW